MGTPFSRQNQSSSGSTVSAVCPQLVVRVAVCTEADDPTQNPTWGDFTEVGVLEVKELYFGSTFGGMSYAKLRLVPGGPVTNVPGQYIAQQQSQASMLIEDLDPLNHGDRVIISLRTGTNRGNDEPRWCGYCVGGRITIDPDKEEIEYRLVGPEWLWGEDGHNGAYQPVYGQIRMTSAADDAATASPTYAQLMVDTDSLAVFNPHGRKNCSTVTAILNSSDSTITGSIWEVPDRQKAAAAVSAAWNQSAATQTLIGWYNDPTFSGMNISSGAYATLDNTKAIRETNVDGMSLWAAVKQVLAPDCGMYVDPVPSAPDQWAGMGISFFQCSTGAVANFTLNEPGTSLADADASIARINASKETQRSVNKVSVLGKATRHIQLSYNGSTTASGAMILQHGWGQTEDELSNYAANNAVTSAPEVDSSTTIPSKGSTALTKWQTHYCTDGANFTRFSHIFRMFVWNESGEYTPGNSTTGAPLYGTSTTLDWFAPNLAGIADNTGFGTPVSSYVRRRRKLLDTVYPDSTQDVDKWRRVPPTLYMAGIGVTTSTQSAWYRVPKQFYRVDHERGAVWIIAKDLAAWKPFKDQQDPDEPTVNDDRTYATLLHTGKLRMMLECSIDCDIALTSLADREATAGSPLIRQGIFREPQRFVQSLSASGLATSPSGITPNPVDDSADALDYAQRIRSAGERQQVHASVLTSADWPEQDIGTIINGTQGRAINLQSGGENTGPGAQIVGKSVHVEMMKWEYVTESTFAKLHGQQRKMTGQAGRRGTP